MRAKLIRELVQNLGKHNLLIRYIPSNRAKLETRREITPLCFLRSAKNEKPMLLAYCWERRALRRFSIAGIVSVDPVPARKLPTWKLMDLLFESKRELESFQKHYVCPQWVLKNWGQQ